MFYIYISLNIPFADGSVVEGIAVNDTHGFCLASYGSLTSTDSMTWMPFTFDPSIDNISSSSNQNTLMTTLDNGKHMYALTKNELTVWILTSST